MPWSSDSPNNDSSHTSPPKHSTLLTLLHAQYHVTQDQEEGQPVGHVGERADYRAECSGLQEEQVANPRHNSDSEAEEGELAACFIVERGIIFVGPDGLNFLGQNILKVHTEV